jgi:hypothetical protein
MRWIKAAGLIVGWFAWLVVFEHICDGRCGALSKHPIGVAILGALYICYATAIINWFRKVEDDDSF